MNDQTLAAMIREQGLEELVADMHADGLALATGIILSALARPKSSPDMTPQVEDLIFAARRVWRKYGHDENGVESDWTEWVDVRDALQAFDTPVPQPSEPKGTP